VIYLNNDDVAIIKKNELILKTVGNDTLIPKVQQLDLEIGMMEKGGYDHFMLKEIFEQPRSIKDTFRGRIKPDLKDLHLGGLYDVMPRLIEAKRIIIIGCGTSWHAGLVGEYLFEDLARLPVEVEYASEFRYRNPLVSKDDVVIAISQSGEMMLLLPLARVERLRIHWQQSSLPGKPGPWFWGSAMLSDPVFPEKQMQGFIHMPVPRLV